MSAPEDTPVHRGPCDGAHHQSGVTPREGRVDGRRSRIGCHLEGIEQAAGVLLRQARAPVALESKDIRVSLPRRHGLSPCNERREALADKGDPGIDRMNPP